jgi:hypothetical protein
MFNERIIPDLIIYNSDKLNQLLPLLKVIDFDMTDLPLDFSDFFVSGKLLAVPFQISRPLLMQGSSGGENQFFTADFGDINLLYPLFMRFGMAEELNLQSNAIKDSFYYLSGLYKQGILQLSSDHDQDFIDGTIDSIYSSSEILGKIPGDIVEKELRYFPQLGGINPPPLLNYTFLSIPGQSKNDLYSKELLIYLSDIGVQQRITPRSGYLPFKKETYHLLKESREKSLLLEDMDRAFRLPPGESFDRLRFAMPRIYRLIITGRLTIEEGISEIIKYVENTPDQ